MALYCIGDLHLSVKTQKPMDIFGGWEDYMQRIRENWLAKITPEDTVVLAGDFSWGMKIEEALPDFEFIEQLPGKKLLLKGNHDYWWGSVTSMNSFLENNGISSVSFLHNNSYIVDGYAVCGSRGWLFENGQEHNEKIVNREALRIKMSLESVKDETLEKLLFLHYPPAYGDQVIESYMKIMSDFGVRRCFYGHIHGQGHRLATVGNFRNIEFVMISADYINFDPLKISLKNC